MAGNVESLLIEAEPASAGLRIRLLGGVGATTGDGDSLDVGPAKCQALLAALALAAGSAVTVARLVDLVWGEHPPRTADKTLQTYVTRLRKSLGADAIVRTGTAYRLDVPAGAVDVRRFEDHLAAGDVAAALDEWAGPPLAGLDAPGLRASVDGLVEHWLGAVETDLERLVETDAPAAIGRLTELTAAHPFREGLWALLMTALYRAGRQAEALAAYRAAREHLVEELGVEPGPRLRELEDLILRQDDRLGARTASRATAPGSPTGTVTFGFTDIEDVGGLWAADRGRALAAVTRHDELVRTVVAAHDGHVFSATGDVFGVAFHRAGDAVAWATALQRAVDGERWPAGAEVRLRVGLHTGEAEERGADYFGPAVNLASRIATAAHGGQILVSGVVAALVDSDEIRDLGPYRFDGVGAEQHILQLGAGEHPPLRTAGGRRGNLPRRSGRLIGRSAELDAVAGALAANPVVTLVGPGGIGKTRLALAAAHLAGARRDDGAWLVELADFASSGDVVRAVAEVLEVRESPGRSLAQSVLRALRSRRALLVLDNCEHVVDGAASFAGAVAEECPDVTVLATSREGLGLTVEQLVAVGPLDAAGPGVELFNERAAAADRTFDPHVQRDAVEEICRRLDGVPLAIELAAARTRSLAPSDLAARLDDRLRLLSGGRRRSVERHRTLRATIRWSYDLLSPPEQTLFRRLSIFAGSFDLLAAETVASGEGLDVADVNDLLGDLVDRSMAAVESGAFGRRFRLLETMRQFGTELLADLGGSDGVARQHADYVLADAERLGRLLAGPAEVEGAARLAELWPNLRAAVDWACGAGAGELAAALVRPIAAQSFLRSHHREVCDWAERILELTPVEDEDAIVLALVWAGFHHSMTQDRDRFAGLVERYARPDHVLVRMAVMFIDDRTADAAEVAPLAAAEMRARGEEQIASMFEIFECGALLSAGRLDEHDAVIGPLVERFRAAGPPTFLNWTLFMQGASAAFRGDHERAERLYRESAAVVVPAGTRSPNEIHEARDAFRRGEHERAFRIMWASVDELLDVGNMSGTSFVAMEFVNMMVGLGRLRDAAHVLGHMDTTGILDVEGPGFRLLVEDAAAVVAADGPATTERSDVAQRGLDERGALEYMHRVLDELTRGATASR